MTVCSFHNTLPNILRVRFEAFIRFPSGAEQPVAPTITVPLAPQLPITFAGAWVQIPPIPASETGRLIKLVTRYRDRITNAVYDESSVEFIVDQ